MTVSAKPFLLKRKVRKEHRKTPISAAPFIAAHDPIDYSTLKWGKPRQVKGIAGNYVIWETRCRRYQVARSDSIYGLSSHFKTLRRETGDCVGELCKETGRILNYFEDEWWGIFGKDCASLEQAIIVCERDKEIGSVNRDDVLARARKMGWDAIREAVTTTSNTSRVHVPLDKWGAKVGTQQAQINAVITTKWMDMKAILKAANLKVTCYNYLNGLVKKGFLEKSKLGKGWRIKKEK